MSFQDLPYERAARRYLDGGLWPIPVIGKNPPVSGCTGYKGTVTVEKVGSWLGGSGRMLHGKWANNVAIRHQLTLAIDVDEGYGDKDGVTQLAQLAQAKGLSPLPATWSSTARGPESGSRQYFYSTAEDVPLKTKPCKSVELCNYHHRFSVVWPSVHPDTKNVYRWYLPGDPGVPPSWGEVTDRIPTRADFAPLPTDWFEMFRNGRGTTELDPTVVTVDVSELLETFPEGEPDPWVTEWIEHWSDPANHLGHDETKSALIHAFLLGREGHPGIGQLVQLIVTRFSDYVGEKRPSQAQREVESLINACADIAQRKPIEEQKWLRLGFDISKCKIGRQNRHNTPSVDSVDASGQGEPASDRGSVDSVDTSRPADRGAIELWLESCTAEHKPHGLVRRLSWMRSDPLPRLLTHAVHLVAGSLAGDHSAGATVVAIGDALVHHGRTDVEVVQQVVARALGVVLAGGEVGT